ncbi:MAG: G5 domain-containing protein [Clostridia bacterium]|nr:G5 domain-containing protein [Clostridia bacterium]
MKLKNKSMKKIISGCLAISTIMANTIIAFAYPMNYNYEDNIRKKALGEYLSSNSFIVAMANNAETSHEKAALGAQITQAVVYAEETQVEEIPFNTVKRLNTSLDAGQTVTVREGQTGQLTKNVKIKYINGEVAETTVLSEVVTVNPVDKIVEYGSSNEQTVSASVNGLSYKYVIECEATAYDMSPEENGGYGGQTATGVPLDKGVIAVDPRVIPLGSRVYIEALDGSWSYGYAVAADTGGAIKGKRVDLCYRTRSECIQFGRRKCRVYVLS